MFNKLSKFFLFASVFSVVVVMPSTFFPFIGGKYYFFRICIELALAFFLLYWAFEDKLDSVRERLKTVYRHPMFIAVSLFVLFYLLASLFAYDASSAFWSNYERGEGGFQMIHYYLFFLLALLVFKEKKDWLNLFKFSVVSAVLVVLYGVLANSGIVSGFIGPYAQGNPPIGFWNQLNGGRFQGSLGNPAYVAPYLMFALFYLGSLVVNAKNKKENLLSGALIFLSLYPLFLFLYNIGISTGQGLSLSSAIVYSFKSLFIFIVLAGGAYFFGRKSILNSLYFSLLPLFVLFFYLSKTRGGLIGLGVAVLLALVWLFFKTREKTKKIITYILAVVVVGGLFVSWVSFSLVPKCTKIPCSGFEKTLTTNRLLNFNLGEQTFKTRFWTWGSAWAGFKERPIFGWGQENFSVVFDRHFNPSHYTPGSNSETWFDRAHSVVFDYLAETGILGFLSYVGIFVVLFWQILKKRTKDLGLSLYSSGPDAPQPSSNVLALSTALMLAMPVGYLIQGLALFDVLPIYINLFLLLSFATYLFIENERVQQ